MQNRALSVPATLDSLPAIAAYVQAVADAAGLDRKARYRLRLAVDEIATNLVTHGRAGGSGAKPETLDLRAESDERSLTLVLECGGEPFDPRQVPPPEDLHLPAEQRQIGGLGIFLALGSVDQFAFERVGERNRNIFVMRRPAIAGSGREDRSE
jgi:serine/threonine-protein kinase RsbW